MYLQYNSLLSIDILTLLAKIRGRIQIQGPPSGFDIMYLALADRNMLIRFGLKVIWES